MRGEHTTQSVSQPAQARRAVERAVADHCRATGASCDRGAVQDALLVASELTTNAILHGGGVTDFRVDLVAPGVRVSVSDRSERFPVVTDPGERRAQRRFGGHGWPIVCRLSHDIQVSVLSAGGKRISAVVPLVRKPRVYGGAGAADRSPA
ncbi:ATP-binding protein [Streptomyces sp. NBC_00287]|uniref:ATP-binding protein n=1 Tax=Streptomyces sp. NBC_00287 TaxID=2975702 RepID=UPI002E2E4F4F|nr:ATP-binding protein [Streptomyces sp. NBC_00287]